MPIERRPYRPHSIFILNEHLYANKIDRNQAAKIIRAAEGLDRSTKRSGRQNGALGYVGLAVLRALLFRFTRPGNITSPSYLGLMKHTGLCRASIRAGLKRLQASGLLRAVRRLQRKRVARVSPLTGESETYEGTFQARSVYLLKLPRLLSIVREKLSEPKQSLRCSLNKQTEEISIQWKEAVADAFSPLAIERRRVQAGLR